MTRTGGQRRGGGGPRTPEGLERALSNLKQFRREHDSHGAHSVDFMQRETQELAGRILEIVRGENLLAPSDSIAVGLLAVALRRIRQCERHLDRYGLVLPRSGKVRPVGELLARYLREAREYCEALGLTARARARLGLSAGKAFDIAAELARLADRGKESPAAEGDISREKSADPAEVAGGTDQGGGENAERRPQDPQAAAGGPGPGRGRE